MTGDASRVTLRPGRERSVVNRHPWLFSGAIAESHARDGELVEVCAADGSWLARGYYNGRSQIVVRLLTWEREEAVDEGFWRRRIERAVDARRRLPGLHGSALRLVNAESDGIPGLVADLYVGTSDSRRLAVLVLQALTLGVERRKELLARLLSEALSPGALPRLGEWDELLVYERSDVDVRRLEGLDEHTGPLLGGAPPERLVVEEEGLLQEVDVAHGHKTGLYLDQHLNRARVAAYSARAEVLNCFAYTGSFGLHALSSGAKSVTDVDSSAAALELGRRAFELNGLSLGQREQIEGDVFQVLRAFRDAGRKFDAVILDPPKFAYRASQVQAACRGYKDINLLGMTILRPGGVLATFSCSGLVSADLFQKVVFGAALDARREVQILEPLSQAPDHPILVTFPESHYLKGLLCRVW